MNNLGLISQPNVSGVRRLDSLSLGERAGERVVALQVGFGCKDPHPNPLPRGRGSLPNRSYFVDRVVPLSVGQSDERYQAGSNAPTKKWALR